MAPQDVPAQVTEGKALHPDELKKIWGDVALEVSDCAGVTEMLSTYITGAEVPEERMENHILCTLNLLTCRLNDIALKYDFGAIMYNLKNGISAGGTYHD